MEKKTKIPKIIHYCWFGDKAIPEKFLECIKSWKQYCPDYKIMKWDETNIDIAECSFIQEAYKNKAWAFVADYVRFFVLYKYGGLYLDTDVKIIRNIDSLLKNDAFFGFEKNRGETYDVAGGVIGAVKDNELINEILNEYRNWELPSNKKFIAETVPTIITKTLVSFGLSVNNLKQNIRDCTIYPNTFFYPLSFYDDKYNGITDNTCAIHYYSATWMRPYEKRSYIRSHKLCVFEDKIKLNSRIKRLFIYKIFRGVYINGPINYFLLQIKKIILVFYKKEDNE